MELKKWFWTIVFVLVSVSARGEIVTKTLTYSHGDASLEGFLAFDDSIKGKRPGILLVHEWWGLTDYVRERAKQLARKGYVAFALDMYGQGKVTDHPKDASEWSRQITANTQQWRERARAGLAVLEKDPLTDSKRLSAVGYCFGGSTVQQLAFSGADLKGVVSFHGSPTVPSEEDAKRVKAKILICHGAADTMIGPEVISAYMSGMEKFSLDYQLIIYGGATHSFTNPGAGKAGVPGLKYSPSADIRSWDHMNLFLNEIFSK